MKNATPGQVVCRSLCWCQLTGGSGAKDANVFEHTNARTHMGCVCNAQHRLLVGRGERGGSASFGRRVILCVCVCVVCPPRSLEPVQGFRGDHTTHRDNQSRPTQCGERTLTQEPQVRKLGWGGGKRGKKREEEEEDKTTNMASQSRRILLKLVCLRKKQRINSG